MSDLQNQIINLLALQPRVAAPAAGAGTLTKPTYKGWGPQRPTPIYEFQINVSRPEYGSATVYAASASDAEQNVEYGDIDWYDAGDLEVTDTDQQSDVPHNQEDIQDWDDEYGNKYDTDGQPKCSICGALVNDASELHESDDGEAWHCDACH